MRLNRSQLLLLAGACLALVLLMSACGQWQPVQVVNPAADTSLLVDPLLREDYEAQGGAAQFGSVTSRLVTQGGLQCQYTSLGMICYDSQAPEGMRFSFTPASPGTQYATPFQKVLERMGGTAAFGKPLAEPVQTPDGYIEQVYESAVFYAPADNPNVVGLRPLAKMVNMPMHQPRQKKYDRRDNVIFYPVQGELGFHVPVVFDEFIARHGGLETSGQPISEPDAVEVGGQPAARQCFENYCLEYFPTAPAGSQVRMTQLGYQYQQAPLVRAIPEVVVEPVVVLSVLVNEDKAQVSTGETQTFYLLVFNDHTKEPAANTAASLTLMLPSGASYTYEFPATGVNGWSRLDVPPLAEYTHGMMVAYRICLKDGGELCVSDSYLVWN